MLTYRPPYRPWPCPFSPVSAAPCGGADVLPRRAIRRSSAAQAGPSIRDPTSRACLNPLVCSFLQLLLELLPIRIELLQTDVGQRVLDEPFEHLVRHRRHVRSEAGRLDHVHRVTK